MIKHSQPLVEIIWHDAVSTLGWEDEPDVDTLEEICITVGFLIKKGENTVVIASSIDSQAGKQSNSRMKIPLGMIKSIKELNVNYKKEKKGISNVTDEQTT